MSEAKASMSEAKASISEANASTSEANASTSEAKACTSEAKRHMSEARNASASEAKASTTDVNPYILYLPHDSLRIIIGFLDCKTFVAIAGTCRKLRSCAELCVPRGLNTPAPSSTPLINTLFAATNVHRQIESQPFWIYCSKCSICEIECNMAYSLTTYMFPTIAGRTTCCGKPHIKAFKKPMLAYIPISAYEGKYPQIVELISWIVHSDDPQYYGHAKFEEVLKKLVIDGIKSPAGAFDWLPQGDDPDGVAHLTNATHLLANLFPPSEAIDKIIERGCYMLELSGIGMIRAILDDIGQPSRTPASMLPSYGPGAWDEPCRIHARIKLNQLICRYNFAKKILELHPDRSTRVARFALYLRFYQTYEWDYSPSQRMLTNSFTGS